MMRLYPTNSLNSFFGEKKILVIVPHQDDELFLCGTVFDLIKGENNISVLFTTNGDYGNSYYQRKEECEKALAVYGIRKENIFYLGYGDMYDTEYGHLYHAPENEVIMSKAGRTSTYSEEFCFIEHGVHNEYTVNNYFNDLKEVIEKLLPEVIFSNDLDWHPEHRMTSIMLDSVLGVILKENKTYAPLVYKGFVYYIGWDGINDYKRINLESTKKPHRYLNNDIRFELGNPYFSWKERIRFPVDYELIKTKKNHLYKAINKYNFSKNAKRFFGSMMNSDAVFWQRFTNNFALDAVISTSSGNSKYLNDFLIVDSTDIMRPRNMPYDKSVWVPDKNDEQPIMCIDFNEPISANIINLYRDITSYSKESCLLTVEIEYIGENNNHSQKISHLLREFDLKATLNIDGDLLIKSIKVVLDNNKVGFSEIEVLNNSSINFIKIIINGDYAYDYYIEADCEWVHIDSNLDEFEKQSLKLDIFEVYPRAAEVILEKDRLIFSDNFKSCFIKGSLISNTNIFDLIRIKRKGK